tara:strand:+ start:208 stop:450 length:243 start_codon:yes stop_codon:yes gene_type:complete
MKKCVKEVILTKQPCCNEECRLHLDFKEDLNCTSVAIAKHGPMTLEQIGVRHGVSTVRAKQILDASLQKLKKTLKRENTI